MTPRETQTLKTPLGREIEIKTYLTARERNAIRDVYLKHMTIGAGQDGKGDLESMSGEVIGKAGDELLRQAVVSYDGSTENIIERLLNEKADEYDFVLAEADKINTGNLGSAK